MADLNEWDVERHPVLPGRHLKHFDFQDGGRCIYDENNEDAYLIGDAVEVGTDEQHEINELPESR